MEQLSPDIDNLVTEAVGRARAAGLDWLGATRCAARALRTVRPDLTPDEAWALAELAEHDPLG